MSGVRGASRETVLETMAVQELSSAGREGSVVLTVARTVSGPGVSRTKVGVDPSMASSRRRAPDAAVVPVSSEVSLPVPSGTTVSSCVA
jgi:hypothetical protein